MAEEKALLDGLPPMPWYVEEIRPGHDDLARVYDGRHFGVAKPTPDDPVYRRPIAEFIVRAAETIQTIKAQLAAKDEEISAMCRCFQGRPRRSVDRSSRRKEREITHKAKKTHSVAASSSARRAGPVAGAFDWYEAEAVKVLLECIASLNSLCVSELNVGGDHFLLLATRRERRDSRRDGALL